MRSHVSEVSPPGPGGLRGSCRFAGPMPLSVDPADHRPLDSGELIATRKVGRRPIGGVTSVSVGSGLSWETFDDVFPFRVLVTSGRVPQGGLPRK